MRIFKRAAAVLLALVMMLSVAGCGQDIKWIAKKGENSVPVGVYIFFLDNAANQAKTKVPDSTVQVMKQEIDGIPAEEWIINEAKKGIEKILAADDWMKELGVEIDNADKNSAKVNADQYWEMMYKTTLEPLGVSSSSFFIGGDLQNLKLATIFEKIYDKGGEKEIPKADIEKEYLENYYNVSTITANLINPETQESLDTAAQAEIEKVMQDYEKQLKDGASFSEMKKTYEDKLAAAMASETPSADESGSETPPADVSSAPAVSADESSSDAAVSSDTATSDAADASSADSPSSAPAANTPDPMTLQTMLEFGESVDNQYDEVQATEDQTKLMNLKPGEVYYKRDIDMITIYVRNDTQKTKQAFYDDDNKRLSVMYKLRETEFNEELDKRAEAAEVEFNEAALKKYRPENPPVDQPSSTPEIPEATGDNPATNEESSEATGSDGEESGTEESEPDAPSDSDTE